MFVAVAVAVDVDVAVEVLVGEAVGVGLGVSVAMSVRLGVTVGVSVGLGVSVEVFVAVAVFVDVSVGLGVSVAVLVSVTVAVAVDVDVSVWGVSCCRISRRLGLASPPHPPPLAARTSAGPPSFPARQGHSHRLPDAPFPLDPLPDNATCCQYLSPRCHPAADDTRDHPSVHPN